MGEHADPAVDELIVDPFVQSVSRRGIRGPHAALALSLALLVVLLAVAGWMSFRIYQERQVSAQEQQLVEAARQGALNLTTIGYTTVDEDIQRILDSSTGTFRDDFAERAQPFADVVKQAQSTSTGTVTAAGLESRDGDAGQVMVVMSVTMGTADAPEGQPRFWRMRIGVQSDNGVAKISDVKFVS